MTKIFNHVCPACGATGFMKADPKCHCLNPDCHDGDICEGLIITEYSPSIRPGTIDRYWAPRCANCGEYMDTVESKSSEVR